MAMHDMYAEMLRRQQMEQDANLGFGPMPGGMISQTAGSSRDAVLSDATASNKGARSKLKSKQAYADSLRGTKMPEGRTVGPSNIYVGPNWGETLGGATSKLAGGWLSGKLSGKYDKLDEADTKKAKAIEDIKDIRTTEDRDFTKGQAKTKTAAQTLAASIANENAVKAAGVLDMGRVTAAEKLNVNKMAAEALKSGIISFHDPVNPDTAINFTVGTDGVIKDMDKNVVSREYIEGLTPWDSGTGGSMGSADRKYAREKATDVQTNMVKTIASQSAYSKIMRSPKVFEATGYLDPRSLAGIFGWGPDGPEIQDVQRNISTGVLGGMAANLEQLKLTPVSDSEGELLRSDVPDRGTQPYGFVGYAVDAQRPVYNARWDAGIKAGTHTEAQKQAFLDSIDSDTVYLALRSDYPLEQLLAKGVSQAVIDKEQALFNAEKLGGDAVVKMQKLTDEEDAIYAQFPNLRPK